MSSWYAVRCNSQHQFTAARMLEQGGVTVFMPVEIRWGSRRGSLGRCRVVRPLICGYLFVLIDLVDERRVLDIEYVTGFLGWSNECGVTRPLPVPARMIIDLQVDERSGAFDETRHVKPKYRPIKGARAQITSGAWMGFFAKVIATPKGERAHVMIEGPHGRGVVLPIKQLAAAC